MSEERTRYLVELTARQTEYSRRLIVVEMPADCSVDDIEALDSASLDLLATQNGSDSKWDFDYYDYDFELQPEIKVDQETDLPADVVMHLDDDGDLVAA